MRVQRAIRREILNQKHYNQFHTLMKTNNFTKEGYVAPSVDVEFVALEQGIATSQTIYQDYNAGSDQVDWVIGTSDNEFE